MSLRRRTRGPRTGGFGLLEIILVFALVAIAGAITFTVYKSASASSMADDEAQRMLVLGANLSSVFGAQHDYLALGKSYPSIATPNPIGLNFLKAVYPVTSGSANNRWGGKVSVVAYRDAATFGVKSGGLYEIDNVGVDPDVCPKLLANLVDKGGQFFAVAISQKGTSGYHLLKINNQAFAASQGYQGNLVTPSFAQFVSACDDMASYAGPESIDIVVWGR